MKYEYKDMPFYFMQEDGDWTVHHYEKMLVSVPETDEDWEVFEE